MRLPLLAAGLSVALAGCGLIDSVSGPRPLSIQKFEVSPDEVASGGQATLAWEVDGAEAVAINNGIGVVPPKGSRSFPAYYTASYTLTARAGTSTATSTVQLSVHGTGDPLGGPFPSPSPSPTPGPGPTPTPEPTPTPGPEPTPTPTPVPSVSCGTRASVETNGCAVSWEYPVAFPDGRCIELNALTVDRGCPVVNGTSLSVGFTVTAKTNLDSLTWRLQRGEPDKISPKEGSIDVDGETSVEVADTVMGQWVVFEVFDQNNQVRLRVRLTHR